MRRASNILRRVAEAPNGTLPQFQTPRKGQQRDMRSPLSLLWSSPNDNYTVWVTMCNERGLSGSSPLTSANDAANSCPGMIYGIGV